MVSKITLSVSSLASAVAAFGLGALTYSGHSVDAAKPVPLARPSASTPDTLPSQVADAPTSRPTAVSAPVKPAESTSKAKHAKPSAAPETATASAPAPKHAKPKAAAPKAKPKAGTSGPLKDAQDDGKILDDIGSSLLPDLPVPQLPDSFLPFPGTGEGLTGFADTSVDDAAVDSVIQDQAAWDELMANKAASAG